MQQIKRTRAVRCPVCGRGRVIDAAADVIRGACASTARSMRTRRSCSPNAPSVGCRSASPLKRPDIPKSK